jgi:putative heme transporter
MRRARPFTSRAHSAAGPGVSVCRMIRGRLRRRGGRGAKEGAEEEFVEIDPGELAGVFSAPGWLRDVGVTAWLLVGVALFLAGSVWLLALTEVIVIPVITAAVIAAVGSPVVDWLHARRVPRAAGAAMVLLAIVAIGIGMFLLILGGITSEVGDVGGHLSDAKNTIAGWLNDIGVDPSKSENAKNEASASVSDSISALLNGLAVGIGVLSSLAIFLAFTVLSLFFLLKDGPVIRGWAERHLGVPANAARVITQRVLGSLRGYFLGVTIVAAYSALIVFIGALVLGVPLAGTIAVVTFVAGYVPYLGAWTAGVFAVLIALGGAGADAALGMAVVQLAANGILQQLVQPFAMGAALGIHPLAVLVVTIAGGALFGAVGLILAAPLTAAAVKISADLSRARAAEGEGPAAEGAMA